MYTNKRQEKNIAVWKYFLERAQQMFDEAKSGKRRRELQYSIRAFRSLIRERAPLPNSGKLSATGY
jgi:hypothetical protein